LKLQLTINELAKIVNISPDTIRYYNNIGIFKESGKHENGYRYFTIEKIEEIRLVIYLRHLGVSLKKIEKHLTNRNINKYEEILQNQLNETKTKIDHFQNLEKRLRKRMDYLKYINNLPEIDKINIEHLPKRRLLVLKEETYDQYDFEKALVKFEQLGNLPPSLIIGDQGFIVDLKQWDTRNAEDFAGMYMIADDPYVNDHILLTEYPESDWATVYLRGDHKDALEWYGKIIAFASDNNLSLANFALERILIDHYISNDPTFYITEIQIPIERNNM
jgi:Predicted transcriptional regulators